MPATSYSTLTLLLVLHLQHHRITSTLRIYTSASNDHLTYTTLMYPGETLFQVNFGRFFRFKLLRLTKE